MLYLPALDGLRALAVLAVLAYHAGAPGSAGGFLGVDVFFVLSGFLITSLLVSEQVGSGRIALARFWGRRARRLLPALLLMLVGVAAYAAVLAPPDSLGALRRAGLATLGYAANWNQVLGGQGYFAQLAAPSPLLHTWSLAIEEQFYLVWPVLVAVVLSRRSTRAPRPAAGAPDRRASSRLLALCLAGAAASAATMALLYRGGAGIDRVYYGTDTRSQALLLGAALAAVLQRRPDPLAPPGRKGSRAALGAAGAGGFLVLLGIMAAARGGSGWLYRGGFTAVALAACAVVASVVLVPDGPGARAVSLAPLRYLGRISYGLYLWHWPVFLVLDHARTGLTGAGLLAARVGAAVAVAAASYHLVETPIRRGALSRWRSWVALPAVTGAVATALVVGTVAPAGASLPSGVSGALAAASRPSPADPTTAGASDLASGTDSLLPAVPAGTGGPIRALLVGDSTAMLLSLDLGPTEPYGVQLRSDAVIGCGLMTGGLVANRGTVSDEAAGLRSTDRYVRCDTWPQRWTADVARYHPDVAVLMDGAWEVRDRYRAGHWVHIGQPGFDRLELAALERAVEVLGAGGAQVALVSSPYYSQPEQADGRAQPADDPARVDRYNALLRRVAAAHPGQVRVVGYGRVLSPGGRFTAQLGGVRVRDADGIHVTADGARLVEPWLMARLDGLGRAARGPSPGG